MKKILTCIIMLSISTTYTLHKEKEETKFQIKAEFSQYYAQKTIDLLRALWENNLALIPQEGLDAREWAKTLYVFVEKIKAIKESPTATFAVLQSFHNGYEQLPKRKLSDIHNPIAQTNERIFIKLEAIYQTLAQITVT